MTKINKKEKLDFQAEVSRLLDIVANSLYSEREIFLRELISNSADACEKLRYLSISNEKLLDKEKDFKINIKISKKNRKIIVEDNGIGMSKNELVENLGTIARSGTTKFIESIKENKEKNDNISAIGQFGVGFYSSYMVANNVTVETKKAGEKESWIWKSDGKSNYTIEESKKEKKGTIIELSIKKDSDEFLDSYRLRSIISKYSNYITFPITLHDIDEKDSKSEQINEGEPLWLKDKKSIKNDEYNQFYKNISFNFDDPIKTIHYKAEGVINYTSLLYIPTNQSLDLFNPDRKNKIKLYVQKVFISDECENIIPNWLRFIPGIIDSEDISLNISREMLQNNPVISKIKKGVTNKIINELKSLLDKDFDKFIIFWQNFGAVIKEGLYENNEYHDEILKILHFKYSLDDNKWISLDEYLKSIKSDQKEIYYFANIDKENLKRSPQLEAFIDKKIPVIFMTDPVDEFWLQNINKYKDKEFKSITKGSINLQDPKNNADKIHKNNNEINNLVNILKVELKNKIKDVRISKRLTKSPLILIADEDGIDINMEKIMKMQNKSVEDSKKILEINPNHSMIKKLSKSLDKLNHKKVSNLLLDNAYILDGNIVKNPSEFIENLTEIFVK
ncbi:MAG: Chaperone protein HtpG [Alphaproteobacteria bacterium MarineAlpha5_Bin11]|nr:molecular chaperone HtpG [Pelagibacteraceae bacterium]PPR43532.1 MAG: Chaperone protein HtpG [Alphaproteobacteria bacterium MarineAlpha5_Bin11]PPR51110.1 MAG: Chaperone protein HtpG [Alphaproteobacteria bacterium MarineAlpha5_Bin10]|tara:strand:- start:2182 stop:4044 length:1863 start_codon:yes stop_codon:yes gene_type:complete